MADDVVQKSENLTKTSNLTPLSNANDDNDVEKLSELLQGYPKYQISRRRSSLQDVTPENIGGKNKSVTLQHTTSMTSATPPRSPKIFEVGSVNAVRRSSDRSEGEFDSRRSSTNLKGIRGGY